jgi:hypothetical protein
MISGWSQDNIDLGEIWHTDWAPRDIRGYLDCDRWQGVLCDFAWIVEHAYGFPGRIIPQAYMFDDDYHCQNLLFRLGNRYLVHNTDSDQRLRSWPVFPSNRNRYFDIVLAQFESYTCLPAITEARMYTHMIWNEMNAKSRRNRWIEQAERGGRPHENLLIMPPVSDGPHFSDTMFSDTDDSD